MRWNPFGSGYDSIYFNRMTLPFPDTNAHRQIHVWFHCRIDPKVQFFKNFLSFNSISFEPSLILNKIKRKNSG